MKDKEEYLVGIDEAGRGPLAGPVAIGTSFIPKSKSKSIFNILKKIGLNDSKKVKEETREKLYEVLKQLQKKGKINWSVTLVSAKIISTKGISYAINFGIKKNLGKILSCHPARAGLRPAKMRDLAISIKGSRTSVCLRQTSCGMTQSKIILELDGALKVPKGNWKKSSVIIKGDSIKPSIMIASIIAKVTRDRHMKKLSKKYPQYGFEIHKGYGTLKHRNLIKEHGISSEHRIGWCK